MAFVTDSGALVMRLMNTTKAMLAMSFLVCVGCNQEKENKVTGWDSDRPQSSSGFQKVPYEEGEPSLMLIEGDTFDTGHHKPDTITTIPTRRRGEYMGVAGKLNDQAESDSSYDAYRWRRDTFKTKVLHPNSGN